MWLDKQHNVICYDTPLADRVAKTVPGSRRLSNGYVCVPNTLYSIQLCRWLGLEVPAPMDDNYDWPGRYKPFEAQRVTANFLSVNPRAFVLSDMGCVGGETLIDTAYGKQRIDDLAKEGRPFPVRTITQDGPRYVEVNAPFRKGHDKLYRVTFKSGRSIVVTKRHVFLTCRGWVSCEALSACEQLPVFDVYPQVSTWEHCRVRFLPDARRLKKIVSDSRGYYETLVCDAPLLSAANIDLTPAPSLAYAQVRNRFEWRTDEQGNKYIRKDPTFGVPPSTLHCGAHYDQGEMGAFLSEYATRQSGNQFHISAQYHLFPSPLREAPEDQELRLCIPTDEASAAPFDTVLHIAYERTDVYYDMEVPSSANYVAHGLCNHNTGKTLAALWAADYILRQFSGVRVLVVCPLSTMQRVWADAIFTHFLGKRTAVVLHGSAAKRKDLLAREADFYIINFDGLAVISAALAVRSDIRMAIVDECSAYRDRTTARHKLARSILATKDYLWMMTGTPTPNGPEDAYGMAKLVNNANGESFYSYQDRVTTKISLYKRVPKSGSHAAAMALLQPSVRFSIDQCVDLPPMTVQQREVELSPEQTAAYKEMKNELVLQAKAGPITAANEAVLRGKLIQISCGRVYGHAVRGSDRPVHHLDCRPRLAALREVIAESLKKIIIFAPLRSVLGMLYDELKDAYSCEVIHGDVGTKERNRILSSFQQAVDPRIIIADPHTVAEGVDLYEATTVIWFAPTDKTLLYLQGNKRHHRTGQKFPCVVVQLAATAIEREIYRRLESNETLQGLLLKLVQEG